MYSVPLVIRQEIGFDKESTMTIEIFQQQFRMIKSDKDFRGSLRIRLHIIEQEWFLP